MKISERGESSSLTRASEKKQIGLSPQLGIGDAYRPHSPPVDRITMKRNQKAGEQLFRFCYQAQSFFGSHIKWNML